MDKPYYNKIKPYLNKENDYRKTIRYQLVDNNFPLSTEEFQAGIEASPMCLDKTEFIQQGKTRYIKITIREGMTEEEIFNFGKRISIIEQKVIAKSKEFVENTINKGVATSHLKFINSILETLKYKDVDVKSVVERIKNYVKTANKPIKTKATRSKIFKK